MNKVCRTCKETKDENDFSFASSGKKGNNFSLQKRTLKSQCKACDAAYAREFRKKNKNYQGSGKISKYGEDRALISAIRLRCSCAKRRVIKYKHPVPYDLNADAMLGLFKKQNGLCALSGEPLRVKTNHLATLSIDKINPVLGYVLDNVQWVCWAVNRAKGEMTEVMFLNMCRTITEKCNDYSEGK